MNAIILSMLLMLFSPASSNTYETVLRDEIAMEYMEHIELRCKQRFYDQIAIDAYKFADAMMKARAKGGNENVGWTSPKE